MNKKQFIKELKNHLKHLQEEEFEEVIADYLEHIEIGISEGRDEKEVVKSLGKPKVIAKHIIANHYLEKAKEKKSPKNILRAVLATIGVGFFNLIFILGPFLAICGVLFGIIISGLAFLFSGIAGIGAILFGIVEAGIPKFAAVFFLISISCAGSLILILSYYLTKLFGILTLKYLKLNIKVIKKAEGEK